MENVSDTIKTGVACIKQKQPEAEAKSGFRPPAYQSHLREVWDKWAILKRNETEVCKAIKDDVSKHWKRHKMIAQPGVTSNHSSGNAVDMAGVAAATADKTAEECDMVRPYANDPVHFQPVVRNAPK